jgi:hypothetical protein
MMLSMPHEVNIERLVARDASFDARTMLSMTHHVSRMQRDTRDKFLTD